MIRARQSCASRARRICCRGQALTEFLVVSLVLLPLFLLVPMIGKYQDISHATQMASRYAAFDAVLRNDSHNSWKPPVQLEAELRQRYFGPAGGGIVTAPKEGLALREGWDDPWGHALIRAPEDVALTFGVDRGPAHADGYTAARDTAIFPLAGVAGLGSKGIYRANVAVTLANLPAGLHSVEPFDQLNLRIERHASVLPDPWAANAPAQTENRAGALAPITEVMPTALIDKAVEVIDMKAVRPPVFGDLKRWRDLVPADRLRAAEAP
jgi:hypothetical protein